MCGVAAIFSYGASAPPVDRDELIRIRDQMKSRGPDGEGEWISTDRRIGLGHRRLSIIDVSPAGAQPMWNADRSLAIIYNGEIYNYQELRSQLIVNGYSFKSHCDTEVLLALYEQHSAKGQEQRMFEKLRGMYAFAIWDEERQCLFVARDPFGIKPLYYSDNGHTLRLASQVKALRAGGQIDLTPDPAGHVGFFLWGHVPDPYTMYKGIRSLPAGHFMRIDRDGVHAPREFCSISGVLRDAELDASSQTSDLRPLTSRREEHLRSALAETVRYHLVADVPVGVFLSSGLDSTTIASLAAEQGGTLRTVTLGFQEYKGTANDETPLAEEFAKRCGAQHQTIWVSRGDFEAERDHLFEAMDRPSTDGVNTFFVSLAAKEANLKVALSGLGGDELFASYPSFQEIPKSVGLLGAFPQLRTFGAGVRILSAPILSRLTSPKYAGLFEYGGTYSGGYLLRRGMFMPWELPELLDPDLVRAGWQELQTLLRLDETLNGIRNPRLKVSALEMNWYMRHQLLRDSDWAGMGHSLEIRVPFVDVELLRQLGPLLASDHAPSKRDAAQTAISRLPSSIQSSLLDRPKTGFQIPVRDWLMTDVQPSVIHSERHAGLRGLRGWAKHVYRHFPGHQLRQENAGKRARGQRSDPPKDGLAVARVTGQMTAQPQSRSPVVPSSRGHAPKRILVFRIGQLGDTIVAVPTMAAVRQNFPEAHIALLSDRHPGKSYVLATDLLKGAGIFDAFLSYPVEESGEVLRRRRMAGLLMQLRREHFDTLVYLAPTNRTPDQIARDRRFFSLAGIKNFIGMAGFTPLEAKRPGVPLAEVPRESELLLRRLAGSGLHTQREEQSAKCKAPSASPLPLSPLQDTPSLASNLRPQTPATAAPVASLLRLGAADEAPFERWLAKQPSDGDRPGIAVGPGSKMPAKRWPLRRFEGVVRELINEFDIWPVVFGGPEDHVIGDWLLARWGRGYNAAGALGIRPSLVAMQRCTMFLGNDTGTMHMAAAAGLPCVAIFSARERPGLWYPAGETHGIFRSEIDCEGCGLIECIERANECLKMVSSTEVLDACRHMLRTKLGTRKRSENRQAVISVAS